MSDILQEIGEKIKKIGVVANNLLADQAFFTSGLLVLVAVASFGLGRQSVRVGEEVAATNPDSTEHRSVLSGSSTASTTTSDTASETDTFYVASKNGKVYHLPYCSGAKRINEQNKITFKTKAEAEAAGLRPAANCPGI